MSEQPEVSEIPVPEGVTEMSQRVVHIPFPESFVYANCCAFSVGQMEIRMGFAEAMPDGHAISRVGVVLPPETAAIIALVLFEQVTIYEKNFGEIRHPMWKAMKAGQNPESPYVNRRGPSVPETQTHE